MRTYDASPPLFYSLGSYNPWSGNSIGKWRYDKYQKITVKRDASVFEDDAYLASVLFRLQPGTTPLRAFDGTVHLVLGILPSGDYAILIPSSLIEQLRIRITTLPASHHAGEFLSMSTIVFLTPGHLAKILGTSTQRRAAHKGAFKKGNSNGTVRRDAVPSAVKFAAFEHNRLFYQAYFIGYVPTALGIPTNFPQLDPKIVVLQFNFLQVKSSKQDADDVLLDAAWGLVDYPSKTIDDITYLKLNPSMNIPGRAPRPKLMKADAHLVAELGEAAAQLLHLVIDPSEVASQLRQFFQSLDPFADIIILAHDMLNLSRAFCFLKLDDLFPAARQAIDTYKPWEPSFLQEDCWEGLGLLVGYPSLSRLSSVKMEADATSYQNPYDATCQAYSQRSTNEFDSERRASSTVSSNRYVSASPFPEGSREGSSYAESLRSDTSPYANPYNATSYTGSTRSTSEVSDMLRSSSTAPSSRYPSTSPWTERSREGSAYPDPSRNGAWSTSPGPSASPGPKSTSSYDRYDRRADRDYQQLSNVKSEPDYRRQESEPLFRPETRSPSRGRSTSPARSASRYASSAPFITPLKEDLDLDAKFTITPLQDLEEEKPIKKSEDDEKKRVKQEHGEDVKRAKPDRRVLALDTQALYATMGRTWTERRELYNVSIEMGLRDVDEGLCAGNELHDIWDITKSMLSGAPVLFAKKFIQDDVTAKKAEEELIKFEEQQARNQQSEQQNSYPVLGFGGNGTNLTHPNPNNGTRKASSKDYEKWDEFDDEDDW